MPNNKTDKGPSLDRYHILEQLGEGGMAVVYKAYDTQLEREVALKVLRSTHIANEKFIKRFKLEAKALAKLNHPNIVKILDYGEKDGLPYLVMEYIPGRTLKQKVGKPVDYREAAKLLIPIAQALAYAHKHKILHRDVKPSNILIQKDGTPMLSDFGIAKILELDETLDLTGTGVGMGTPEYMAPENVSTEGIDERADLYALGIVYYELITGRTPFQADTPLAAFFKHKTDPLPRPKEFGISLPRQAENVLLKSLAKEPKNRYSSGEEMAVALKMISADINQQKRIKVNLFIWIFGIILFIAIIYSLIRMKPIAKNLIQPTMLSISTKSILLKDTLIPTITPSQTPNPILGKIEIKDEGFEEINRQNINKLEILAIRNFWGFENIIASFDRRFIMGRKGETFSLISVFNGDVIMTYSAKDIIALPHFNLLSISNDGKYFAVFQETKEYLYAIRIVNLLGQESDKIFYDDWHRLASGIVFSPDPDVFAFGRNSQIYFYSISKGKSFRDLETGNQGVDGIQFSPDGQRLVSNRFSEIIIWSMNTRKPLKIIQAKYEPFFFRFSNNNSLLAIWSISYSGMRQPCNKIELIDLINNNITTKDVPDICTGDMIFSPMNDILFLGIKNYLSFYNSTNMEDLGKKTLEIGNNNISYLSFSEDGKILATIIENGDIYYWGVKKK